MKYAIFAPAMLVEDANGIHQLNSKSLMLKNRVIFLDTEIDEDVVHETIRQLILLGQQGTGPVTVILDTPGGSIKAGFQLIDVLESCPFPIRTVALGCAASMGAIILAAGTKGQRFVSKRSKVMIHEPLLAGGISCSTSQIETVANDLIATRETINEMLCAYTGKDMITMRNATCYDHYFTADEAVGFGLADAIAEDEVLFAYLSGGEVNA